MEAIIEQPNALILQIEQNHLEPETGLSLKEKFLPFFEQAEAWKTKAETLVVTDVSQVREMKMAREARLALKDIRVNVEKTRKELKEDSLRKGKAIDGIANVIKYLIEPIESHLEQQERFAEVYEAKRKAALKSERTELLTTFGIDVTYYDLGNMPEESFNQLLSSAKIAHEQRAAEARRIEEEKILRQKAEAEERERIRLENVRLRQEAEEREKVLVAERQQRESERKELEEKARAEREAFEAEARKVRQEQEEKFRKEREERQRAEAELRAKKMEEERLEQEKQAAIEYELSKGDKQKFTDLLTDLSDLKAKYVFKSKKYKTYQVAVIDLIDKIIVYGKTKIQ